MMGSEENKQYAPILVTGAHRTGTTWVGKMLCASGEAAYISEPLNVYHRPGVFSARVKHWYTYINRQNEAQYLPAYQDLLHFRYHTLAEITSLRERKDFLRMGRDFWTFIQGKLHRQRPLLKDPFAVFSIPWFIEQLKCQVVVTVRHPAGFASSLKRLGWNFSFADLLAQPLLMPPGQPGNGAERLLSPSEPGQWIGSYRAEIDTLLAKELGSGTSNIIAQASLLWAIIYRAVAGYQSLYPDIRVVRHEDLSLNPGQGYAELYAALGLNFTKKAQEIVLQSSSAENPKEGSRQNAYAVHLDSRANLENWKKRLTPLEIEQIRQISAPVAEAYYPDFTWK